MLFVSLGNGERKNRPSAVIFFNFAIKKIDFNFDFSFFHLAKIEMNRRCIDIDFHFQLLILDGNQMDENHMVPSPIPRTNESIYE